MKHFDSVDTCLVYGTGESACIFCDRCDEYLKYSQFLTEECVPVKNNVFVFRRSKRLKRLKNEACR